MRKLICRWIAGLLALPMFIAMLALPEAWPLWLLGWFVIAAMGFG